jgi:hypothetical protein
VSRIRRHTGDPARLGGVSYSIHGEYEYRYIIPTDAEEPYAFVDYADALRAIFLGQKYPEAEESIARSLADSDDLDLYRLIWVNGGLTRATVGV